MSEKPFPKMHGVAKPADNPNGFRVFELPRQQEAFDDFAIERGLYRQGGKRSWKNIDARNTVRLEFQLEIPPHLRGQALHRVVRDPTAPNGERSIDLWPASDRRVRVVVAAGATCVLPELWSSAILIIDENGIIRGGAAPASMRPVGIAPAELDEGLRHLTPEPPEAA